MSGPIERIGFREDEPAVTHPGLRAFVDAAAHQPAPRLSLDARTLTAAWIERREKRRRVLALAVAAGLGALAVAGLANRRPAEPTPAREAVAVAAPERAAAEDPREAPGPERVVAEVPDPVPAPAPVLAAGVHVQPQPHDAEVDYEVTGEWALALREGTLRVELDEGTSTPVAVALPERAAAEDPREAPGPERVVAEVPDPVPAPAPVLAAGVHVQPQPHDAEVDYEVTGEWALALREGTLRVELDEGTSTPVAVALPEGALEIHGGVTIVEVAGMVAKVTVESGSAVRIEADGTRHELAPTHARVTPRGDASQPSASALAAMAEERLAAGDRSAAIKHLGTLVRKYPSSAAARTGLIDLARLLKASGRTDEARCAYRSWLDRNPRAALRGEVERALQTLGDGPGCRGLSPRR